MSSDYEVGYRKPPREHQFQPGRSGNPRGRPKRLRVDIAERLLAPIAFSFNGKQQFTLPFEAGLLSLVARATKGDMRAARRFLAHCNSAGLLERPKPVEERPYDYRVPRDWGIEEWWDMFQRFGPPPWKGERDGLCIPRWEPNGGR